MLTIPRLLSDLQAKGVVLSLLNGELNYRAPTGALTPLDREHLSHRREDVVTYLAAMSACLRGPVKPQRSVSMTPSLLQELWWTWYGRPPRQLNQERLPLVKLFRHTSLARIEQVLRQIITRHDTLRTSFREEHGQLLATLNPVETFSFEYEERSGGDYVLAELETQLKAQAAAFSEQQLPLDGQWLIRAKIISISPSDFLVLMVFHHIIVDAASLFLILAELETLLVGDAPPSLSPAAQFIDYAGWERAWMGEAERKPLINYWARWLRNRAPLIAPVSGKSLEWRPGLKIDYKFSFTAAVLRKINAYAVSHSTSLFNVFLTVFGVALARWSGNERFPIRCVGDLRTSPELAPIVGYMVCSDVVEIAASRAGDFVSMLKANEIEYHSSLMLRLPTLLRHPMRTGGQGIEDPRHIAATINMFSIRLPPGEEGLTAAQSAVDEGQWPPLVASIPGEPWPILLPSIFLRLIDFGHVLQGSIELNDDLLEPAEQTALIDTFFEVVAEFLLH
jgi:hypothetical protein